MVTYQPGGVCDENARGEGQGKGPGVKRDLRVIEGGVDPEDSESRRQF